ncbi:ABC transporter permease [Clostridium sp.]|uniref:ABC transporter permease n=1 Tax=Clostridium sp. TaxID=1506 RepID=UPI00260826CC|nr:ABC transporter permease [Clostridium sp.]
MIMKFVKREEISKKQQITITIIAVFLALVVSGIFLLALKLNPMEVYAAMIKGALGDKISFRQTIIKSIPLAITGLGIAVAFKMKYWNIGGEGQILMGAFGAALIALKLPNLPQPIMIITMFLSGMFFAGIWALIPGYFRCKWKVNESIITLMMNYIALKYVTYLQYGPWKDKQALGFPKIATFSDNAILPKIFNINIGLIIAPLLAIIVYIFLNKTKKGFEIAIIGESEKTAKYSGIKIKNTMLEAIVISGVICGIAGVVQASGVSETLSVEVAGGVGYTAIIIACLAKYNPFIIMIVSFLFATLVQGGTYIQTIYSVPDAVALIIQSMILFFVLGSEIFINYKIVVNNIFNKKNKIIEDKKIAMEVE